MRQQIRDDPLRHIALQVPMEVAIVVNDIHLLVDSLDLIQDILGRRLVDMLDHVFVDELKVGSQDDVEIDGASEAVQVVSSESIDDL